MPPPFSSGLYSTHPWARTTSSTAIGIKRTLQFTVISLANTTALYNFLSTLSGTHYVSPRTETMELGFQF